MNEWRDHPLTRQLILRMREDLDALKDGWVGGSYVYDSYHASGHVTGVAIGKARSITDYLEFIDELSKQQEEHTNV